MCPYIYVGLDRPLKRKYLLGIPETSERVEALVTAILETVSSAFGLAPAALLSRSRLGSHPIARSVCLHLIRERTDLTLTQIGQIFSGRHYSTIIHGLDLYSDLMQTDKGFRQKVKWIKSKIHENTKTN